MALAADVQEHRLNFKFDAGTSRGVLKEKVTYILSVWDSSNPELVARGEAGPLPGLSPDYPKVKKELSRVCQAVSRFPFPTDTDELFELVSNQVAPAWPAVRFALETALLDLVTGSKQLLFPGSFTEGQVSIPINGLIWMGDKYFMKDQIDRKVSEGYNCIKMKIGAIDFGQECELLEYIRSTYGRAFVLRLDANGAFSTMEATGKLEKLAQYHIHSIEQPITAGQLNAMSQLCKDPVIPVALDEELIGVTETSDRIALLDQITPQFIILKPTLLGGFEATREWIRLAEERNIGWWITSALESNIGLNAIAQFTATLAPEIPQGLGTGQLYHNNIPPHNLHITAGRLHYKP